MVAFRSRGGGGGGGDLTGISSKVFNWLPVARKRECRISFTLNITK